MKNYKRINHENIRIAEAILNQNIIVNKLVVSQGFS